jgi:hypothetical protein
VSLPHTTLHFGWQNANKPSSALQGGGLYVDGCISDLLSDSDFTNSIVSVLCSTASQLWQGGLQHVLNDNTS